MKSHHKHAPWRKAVLVPFWTLQLLLELLMIVLLAFALGFMIKWKSDDDANDLDTSITSSAEKESKIVVPIWLFMIVICLILTITEIVLLAKQKLKPVIFVIMNTIKSGIWTIIFVLDVVSVVDKNSRTTSGIAIVIEALLYLCFLVPLIYGSIIYHRFRREKKTYAPVVVDANAPTEYPSQYQNFVVGPAADVERGPPGARRLSYNHERDTRFDAFQQRRSVSYGDASMGDVGMGERGVGPYEANRKRILSVGSPDIPTLIVEHHDGEVYEMESHPRAFR